MTFLTRYSWRCRRLGAFCSQYDSAEKSLSRYSVSQVQKNISEHGFSVKRMDKAEIKRMLALYFGASIIGDEIPDIEGENYIKEADTNEEKN